VDNTPTYMDSADQKPSRKKTIWLVIIILALIASNVGWALFYLKQQGELTAKINTLTAQNIKLAKDNKELQNADSETDDNTEYREIPELGVKYKVTDENKDLTYSYSVTSGDQGAGLDAAAIAFKSTFKAPVEDQNNNYEGFPYTAVITKWPTDKLKEFTNIATSDFASYQKDFPKYVKKVGDYTYVMVTPDGGGLNPRAKAAITKQESVENTLQSFIGL
jgi:hypothetical protein